jgi:hypothetical protein
MYNFCICVCAVWRDYVQRFSSFSSAIIYWQKFIVKLNGLYKKSNINQPKIYTVHLNLRRKSDAPIRKPNFTHRVGRSAFPLPIIHFWMHRGNSQHTLVRTPAPQNSHFFSCLGKIHAAPSVFLTSLLPWPNRANNKTRIYGVWAHKREVWTDAWTIVERYGEGAVNPIQCFSLSSNISLLGSRWVLISVWVLGFV